MTKQAKRRKLAKLRSCLFDGNPWSIMSSAIGPMCDAVNSGDMNAIEASLSFGSDVESITKVVNGVAVIPVTGVLRDEVDWMVRFGYASSYQLIEREYKQQIGNNGVKAVLFYFTSPGGSAIGCKRAADTIFEMRGEKPVRAYVQGVCGSAAYYMAAACDRIEATADSLVGSIGTIYPHMEMSGMLEEIGIGANVFTNSESPKKGHGNQYEKLTPDAKATLQNFTNSYGSSFVQDVARYRGESPQNVAENYGKGDAFRADIAIGRGMIDSVVSGFSESLESISGVSSEADPVAEADNDETPVVTGHSQRSTNMKIGKKIRAQLFARGMIESQDVSDEVCQAAINAWFAAGGQDVPSDEAGILASLLSGTPKNEAADADDDDEEDDDGKPFETKGKAKSDTPRRKDGIVDEHAEAKLEDLRASAALTNEVAGSDVITGEMVMDAFEAKLAVPAAQKSWNEKLVKKESAIPAARGRDSRDGSERFAADAIDAMVYRSVDQPDMTLSDGAAALVGRPLWSIAGQCLQLEVGERNVDMYGSRELLAEEAMQQGNATRRSTFFSGNEDRRYIQAAGAVPNARPGDFPNILSGLANKFLDTVELDEDYSFPKVSALLPGGLNDFKPALMMNKGVVEELDELSDAEKFKELGLAEEVLSYIFLRRFGNCWGWTPVLVANDDLNAFAEGMIGLREAWMVTQNRLVVDRFTSTENLLDSSALFADRADTGTGTNAATNHNIRASGAAPSDAEWAAMEVQYADIGGVATGKRVRGTLNVAYVPTGAVAQEARRTFMPLNGLEPKAAATTANVGLYRGDVSIVTESELRINSTTRWIGLRNPTRLNTATVVRAYFNGFGTAGRRERWYDPTNKTTWVSLEGRVAVAVKNWRYAVVNEV